MTEPSVARLFSWQELMLEQERLSCDPAHAARAEEFREGDKQVGRQEEQIAHASNIITPVIARKTARQRLIRTRFTIYEFATDTRKVMELLNSM